MSEAIVKDAWRLVDDKNQPVNKGDRFDGRDGFKFIVNGGQPPHKPSSSGRVNGNWESGQSGEYFPHVFNLSWIKP